MISICYVPIGVATYVPMTIENIEQHCARVGQVRATDYRYLDLVTALGKAESGVFDKEAVRVKLIGLDSEPVYIDNLGGVSRGARHLRLSASSLTMVKRLIEGVTNPRV